MGTRAKERSPPWLEQPLKTAERESKCLPPQVAQQQPSAFLHEFSFVRVQPLLPVLLESASSAPLQPLAFDSTPWPQFSSSVPPFSFSVSAPASPRDSRIAPEDLTKSHPAPALNVHQPPQPLYTEWR